MPDNHYFPVNVTGIGVPIMCQAVYIPHSHGLPCEVVVRSSPIFEDVEADRGDVRGAGCNGSDAQDWGVNPVSLPAAPSSRSCATIRATKPTCRAQSPDGSLCCHVALW